MNFKQKYRICRNIRFILIFPLIFIFSYLVGSLISMSLLLVSDRVNLRISVSFVFAILICIYILRYFFMRYKQLKYSNLFIKNPKLSLMIFCIENLSLIILYAGFLYFIISKYLYGSSEYINTIMSLFGFLVAPVCVLIFIITYFLNKRKENE